MSTLGRIRSFLKQNTDGRTFWTTVEKTPHAILSPALSRDGYLQVGLRTKSSRRGQVVWMLHQIVAKSFLPNPENLPQVNHLTALKTDNRLWNLEWASRSRNIQHAFDHGLNTPRSGEANGMSKLSDNQVREIRLIATLGYSGRQIAKYYGVTPTMISRLLLRRTYAHIH